MGENARPASEDKDSKGQDEKNCLDSLDVVSKIFTWRVEGISVRTIEALMLTMLKALNKEDHPPRLWNK